MKKRLFAIILALALCLCLAAPVLAVNFDHSRMIDGAWLLDDDEYAALSDKLDEISNRQQMDIVVVTSEDLMGYSTATECADELYESYGFGFGDTKDGVLLLVSMQERDWAISTCGKAIDVFTDYDCDYISDEIVPYLSDGDYFEAFDRFADLCDEQCTQYDENGDDDGDWVDDEPFDPDNPYIDFTIPREPLSLIWIPISLAVGLVLAFIVVGCMKAKLKTVRFQPAASSYVKSGSMNVTDSSDLFLYATVSRTEKPKNNDSGGSSVHMSSSGTSHGGSSGKF